MLIQVGAFSRHCETSRKFVDSSNQDGPSTNLPEQRPLRQHGARLLPGAALQHPARLRQQQPRHRLLPGTQLHRGAALPCHQGRGRQLLAAEGYLRDHLAGILHRIHARLGYRLCGAVLWSSYIICISGLLVDMKVLAELAKQKLPALGKFWSDTTNVK